MKTVFTVGIELPGNVGEYVHFNSDTCLLDADIIVFRPYIPYVSEFKVESYQGKRCYGEKASFELKERIAHWRRELRIAVDSGKTIFILLTDKHEFFVDSGERTYSGTGRNTLTTRLVESCCNYDVLPCGIEITTASGSVMTLSDRAAILRAYWEAFGGLSVYKVIITGTITVPLVLSKDRNHVFGAIIRLKGSAGNFVLLPDIPFSEVPSLLTEKEGKSSWTKKKATALGHQFLQVIHEIDEGLRSQSARTPMPTWAKDRVFDLPAERRINEELLRLEQKKQALQQEEVGLKQQLNEEMLLKGLLYEQGHALEAAIIRLFGRLSCLTSQRRDSERAIASLTWSSSPLKEGSSEKQKERILKPSILTS